MVLGEAGGVEATAGRGQVWSVVLTKRSLLPPLLGVAPEASFLASCWVAHYIIGIK